jgi:hypothetical protein
MDKRIKYTVEHIKKVHFYMNNLGMSKYNAIEKAGFKDASSFYTTLKRSNLTEVMSLKPKVKQLSFL